MHYSTFLKTFFQTRWRHRFATRSALLRFQEKQLRTYRVFLRNHSPYFKQHNPEDFTGMDKEFMMAYFNDLNTQGIDRDEALALAIESEKTRDFSQMKGEIAVGLSSGTSGHRGLFITTEKERSMWAGAILAKMLPKGKLIGHRIAFFLRADNELYQTINNPFIRLEYFDAFKDPSEHLTRLRDYQPTILVAPASILLELSKQIEKGILSLKVSKVVSVAEILEDGDRERIQKAFRISVVDQIYQATEGFLACTCSEGNLHLNEDILQVEKDYIDTRRFYPIISDFMRSSQPIYRYRLNDILVENPDPCPCGSIYLRIDKIEGRSDDIFYFDGLKGERVIVFPDFIRRCFLFVEGISEYQVVQTKNGELTISLSERNPEIEANIRKEFQDLAQQKASQVPKIHFRDYHWDRHRKLKRIQRS